MRRTRLMLGCLWVLTGCIEVTSKGDAGDESEENGDDAGTSPDASEDVDNEDPEVTFPAVEDPYPEADEPGEYTCADCPSSDDHSDTNFEPNFGAVTAQEFGGSVTGAEGNGTFYVANEAGQAFAGLIPTDADTGSYDVNVPLLCGEQQIKLVWGNAKGKYATVYKAKTTDCVETDIRATLVWDGLGLDFELHLVREGGNINDRTDDRYYSNDCTWNTCISGSIDWGVEGDASDDPRKDVDNIGTFGPENIFYNKPEAGRYTVMVEHWNGSGDKDANGTLIINVKGKPTTVIPITKLAPYSVFVGATIDWPSGEVRTFDTYHECSELWSSGCTAAIAAP